MHHLVTHTGTQQGCLKRARSQSVTQRFPFRGILARGRGLWQEGGVLVKEISDLLGRLPETFSFLRIVKKGGMVAVRGEKG